MVRVVLPQFFLPSGQQSCLIPLRFPTPFCWANREPLTNKQLELPQIKRRNVHSRRHASSAAVEFHDHSQPANEAPPMAPVSSMSILPLPSLIRSYLITSISSYSVLLHPSMAVLSFLAHAKSPLLNPDTSPLLRLALKNTFYAQFCAGETPAEVRATLLGLRSLGYKGVILGHAKEAVLSKEDANALEVSKKDAEEELDCANDIGTWKTNLIATIDLAVEDDFVWLKFTGAGQQALRSLSRSLPFAPAFEQALHEICQRAEQRGVRLLVDAEQDLLQDGIDNWTMHFARIYNKGGKALVYGTYQAYKRKTPGVLARHLECARKEDFVLGVKLVRGAYLGSDARELFWSTVEETHQCFDEIAKSLMEQQYGGMLKPAKGGSQQLPPTDLVLATHNAESVRRAQELRNEQAETGEPRISLAYGQLMGMADNVSCDLVKAARDATERGTSNVDIPAAYKYLVWGKMSECMKYLLRRAQENKDAVSRTVEARKALGKELGRRLGLVQ